MSDIPNLSIELLKNLAEGIRTCLYCTNLGAEEKARPMSTVKVEKDGSIWFFTSTDQDVAHYSNGDVVHLLYADNGSKKYLSVKGNAQILNDRAKAKELWNPILNAWFPKGLDTPELRLICVKPGFAEYWDGVSKVRTLYDAVKAKITGEKGASGDHKELNV